MPKNCAVGLKEGSAEEANRVKRHQVRIVGEEFNDAVGVMDDSRLLYDDFAGSAVNLILKIFDIVAIHPKTDGAKDPAFRHILGNPDACYSQSLSRGPN